MHIIIILADFVMKSLKKVMKNIVFLRKNVNNGILKPKTNTKPCKSVSVFRRPGIFHFDWPNNRF